MLARLRQSMDKRDEGFTLIELLVVMIIIGILAAIAIPVFLNQRKKGVDTAAKADVSTLGKEIATYYVDNTADPAVAIGPPAGDTPSMPLMSESRAAGYQRRSFRGPPHRMMGPIGAFRSR